MLSATSVPAISICSGAVPPEFHRQLISCNRAFCQIRTCALYDDNETICRAGSVQSVSSSLRGHRYSSGWKGGPANYMFTGTYLSCIQFLPLGGIDVYIPCVLSASSKSLYIHLSVLT